MFYKILSQHLPGRAEENLEAVSGWTSKHSLVVLFASSLHSGYLVPHLNIHVDIWLWNVGSPKNFCTILSNHCQQTHLSNVSVQMKNQTIYLIQLDHFNITRFRYY